MLAEQTARQRDRQPWRRRCHQPGKSKKRVNCRCVSRRASWRRCGPNPRYGSLNHSVSGKLVFPLSISYTYLPRQPCPSITHKPLTHPSGTPGLSGLQSATGRARDCKQNPYAEEQCIVSPVMQRSVSKNINDQVSFVVWNKQFLHIPIASPYSTFITWYLSLAGEYREFWGVYVLHICPASPVLAV